MEGNEFGVSVKGIVVILIFGVIGIFGSRVFGAGSLLTSGVMLVVLALAGWFLPRMALRAQSKHLVHKVAMAAEIYHGAINYAIMRRILKDLDVPIEPALTDYQEKTQDPEFIREVIEEARNGMVDI